MGNYDPRQEMKIRLKSKRKKGSKKSKKDLNQTDIMG